MPPSDGPKLLTLLRSHPLRPFFYVALYLGGPFENTFRSHEILGSIAGLSVLALAVRLAWRLLPQGRAAAVELALLGFVGYVVSTALVTALGRIEWGAGQALSGRYNTPNMMNLCVLALLCLPWLTAGPARVRKVTLAFMVLAVALFVRQFEALKPDLEANDRMAGALALELGVRDSDLLKYLYPRPDREIEVAEKARAIPVSIFSIPPILGARDLPGTVTPARIDACAAMITEAVSLPGTGWKRIKGTAQPGQRLLISDQAGVILGVAVQGRDGSIGYLKEGSPGPVYIGDDTVRCGPVKE